MLDNDLYDRVADTWWKDGAFLNFLKAGVNPPASATCGASWQTN